MCEIQFYMLTIRNTAMVKNFQVISNKSDVVVICTSVNYVYKWIIKLYNLQFLLASPHSLKSSKDSSPPTTDHISKFS